ncbi:rhomboid family intramembrane serine protease [Flavobacterium sp. GT3R68]|uniref:rhomboid family intramembrane serine protease n=1 Tax=Flavobacterium sp. GT3R68 TaxID=2594437 RepID=UPI000F88CC95|nr:rhomboid family intramembrane serine protease [Flavobacterium sp. GT3R68]RTY93403.1 rhomboid family intramembrane serine protease [Flavobacterium sp. GSN2]TRW92423.1 rhomboid family intramembrane serine protease [Flavobacterium sp. GT3R68]
MRNVTETVKQLIIINIIFYIGTQFLGDVAYKFLSLYYPENPDFKFWQPVSHMFMHGNLMHIFFNMFALFSFGSALEHYWGAKKFLFFYISCGLGAALIHILSNYYFFHDGLNTLVANGIPKEEIMKILSEGKFDTKWQQILPKSDFESFISSFVTPAVGASGAIYGILVAFAFMFPDAELALMFIPIPIKAKYFVPVIVALDLFSGVTGFSVFGGGIAHFAHVGGAFVGFMMMWYWKKGQNHANRWD